jgi:large subunit ribosomal protein L4
VVTLTVNNAALEPQRDIQVPEELFGLPYRRDLIYEAVREYTANQRLGTHSTKNRKEVSGSGKKLWKQKGTGRARTGERTSPLWYHGGIVFGPKPRDYSYSIPRKVRRAALRSLLSERVRRGLLKVVDALAVDAPKTKEFTSRYRAILENHKTVLFVDERPNAEVLRASRNLTGVRVTGLNELNVYDLARYEVVVFTEPALLRLTEDLKP